MKQLLLIITIVFFALQVKAQYFYNEYDEIIPYSLTEKYKDIVRTDTIHSLVLPSFDNDSLFFKYNDVKTYQEVGSNFACGFTIDSLLNFQDYAKRIEIEEGTLWIMTIESETAQAIGIKINKFDLPEHVYLSIYPGTIPYIIQSAEPGFKKDFDNERIRKRGLYDLVHDKKMVIEFFVPRGVNFTPSYLINKVTYDYHGLGRPGNRIDFEKYKEEYEDQSSGMILKSGGHTNTPALPCQQDVVCPDVIQWSNEAKSVVFIQTRYSHNDNSYWSQGSGFFVNKSGNGYIDSDKPIIVTCRHLFVHEIAAGDYYDFLNNYESMEVYVDYENKACNESRTRYGKFILGTSNINIVKVGDSYDTSSSTYNPSDDYAILQSTKTISKLANYNIEYAGWNKNYNLQNSSNTGYAYIGHPSGDVKKVNTDNGRAYLSTDGKQFGLYCDVGATEQGFSGGPVFNSNSQIVGWVCTKGSEALKPCEEIGKEIWQNRTGCGRIDNLWHTISSYVDPNLSGEAPSSNPQPPSYSELPSHCKNCVQDGDETGIDCGGSCYPCGVRGDVVAIKNEKELIGSVKSRYEIFAEPDPGTLLCLKSGSSSLEAGMNVHLKGGFEVQKGAVFYANVDTELMSAPDRGCQPACVHLANVFTPNGDGINDFWGFDQAFVTNYDLLIWDRNNQTMYFANNQPVYDNGTILAWDGTGTVSGGVYYGRLTYRDCYGNTHVENFFTHVFKDKSAKIPGEREPDEMKVTDVAETPITPVKLNVFPNPVDNYITIDYNGKEFPLEYRLTAINGKLILHEKSNLSNVKIDMSDLPSGAYILNAKAGNYNLIEKLIKN